MSVKQFVLSHHGGSRTSRSFRLGGSCTITSFRHGGSRTIMTFRHGRSYALTSFRHGGSCTITSLGTEGYIERQNRIFFNSVLFEIYLLAKYFR